MLVDTRVPPVARLGLLGKMTAMMSQDVGLAMMLSCGCGGCAFIRIVVSGRIALCANRAANA